MNIGFTVHIEGRVDFVASGRVPRARPQSPRRKKTFAAPVGVAAFHYIHPAYGSVFMFFLLKLFHLRREKSSSTLLVKNRPTIFE